jgi:hypothetical protein
VQLVHSPLPDFGAARLRILANRLLFARHFSPSRIRSIDIDAHARQSVRVEISLQGCSHADLENRY